LKKEDISVPVKVKPSFSVLISSIFLQAQLSIKETKMSIFSDNKNELILILKHYI